MPLSAERTHAVFGYILESITPGMAKRVVALCELCACEFIVIRKNLNTTCTCRKCSFKLVPREHYARGVARRKATCLTTYGQESKPVSASAKEKRRATNMARFGAPTPQQNPVVRAKTEETNLARFGTRHPIATSAFAAKARETMMREYGAAHTLQVPELLTKMRATMLARYGVTNPSRSPILTAKRIETTLTKHGTLVPSGYGKAQNEILCLLDQWGIQNIRCDYRLDRTTQTLDFYAPNEKLAVEYCGLYWHNELSPTPRGRDYHIGKHRAAGAEDIQLVTIFEDEWTRRREQAEHRLKAVFGKNEHVVGGRECLMSVVPEGTLRTFIGQNHLQGLGTHPLIGWGLRYKDELLGVLTLNKHHRQHQDAVVLGRLCFKMNTTVVGGAQKLIETAKQWLRVNNVKSIISWSDNRWSSGGVYLAMGFVLDGDLLQDYSYVNYKSPRGVRLSKQTQAKARAKCPAHLTEREWALERGLARIWDCGHKRWKLIL